VFECVAVTDEMHDDKIISSENYHLFLSDADELSRMLFMMIKNLS